MLRVFGSDINFKDNFCNFVFSIYLIDYSQIYLLSLNCLDTFIFRP